MSLLSSSLFSLHHHQPPPPQPLIHYSTSRLLGYGFAHGVCGSDNTSNGFVGCGQFALAQNFLAVTPLGYAFWMFQWAFAATASSITLGSIAERATMTAHMCYSLLLTIWIFPVVAHWVWSPFGFLSAFNSELFLGTGVIDFAGAGVVHVVGGVAGLCGAFLAGPRTGRFDAKGNPVAMPGHSATLVCLGTFLLWFGWYGFNPGSLLKIDDIGSARVVARSAVITTLCAAAGGITQLVITYYQKNTWDLINVCNGVLSGLVGSTAGSSVIEPYAAVVIGTGCGFIFNYGGKLLLKLKIDDPLEAIQMHAFCGLWGILMTGFFAQPGFVAEVYGTTVGNVAGGVFYGGGKLLAAQVVYAILTVCWTTVFIFGLFWGLKKLQMLRVPLHEEFMGLDVSVHNGPVFDAESRETRTKTEDTAISF
jgi:ammonium transporter, Amt family